MTEEKMMINLHVHFNGLHVVMNRNKYIALIFIQRNAYWVFFSSVGRRKNTVLENVPILN